MAQKKDSACRGKRADTRGIFTLFPEGKKPPNDTWLSSAENRKTLSAKCRKSCSDEKREEAVQGRKKESKATFHKSPKNGQFLWEAGNLYKYFCLLSTPLIPHIFKSNAR